MNETDVIKITEMVKLGKIPAKEFLDQLQEVMRQTDIEELLTEELNPMDLERLRSIMVMRSEEGEER